MCNIGTNFYNHQHSTLLTTIYSNHRMTFTSITSSVKKKLYTPYFWEVIATLGLNNLEMSSKDFPMILATG